MSQPFLGILSKRRGAPVVALVRYIRIRQAVGVTGYIGFDEITAISGGINVALNKTTSFYPGSWNNNESTWKAANAVDGKTGSLYAVIVGGGGYSPTSNAWLMIDLGQNYNLSQLTIIGTIAGAFQGYSYGYPSLTDATLYLEDANNNVHKSYTLAGVDTLQSFTVSGLVPYVPPISFTVANATLGTDYTVTTSGGRTFYTFKATGKTPAMTITNTVAGTVDYLALGGGGGGGGNCGGGGGAGGLQQAVGYTLPAGTRTITIGDGGVGGNSNTDDSGSGENTSFGIGVALGGGGGACDNTAKNGGCGGGSGFNNGAGGIGSQGGSGGLGNTPSGGAFYNGAGGGGVGPSGDGVAAAVDGKSGNGGTGITYNNGTALQLGGGGGGGSYNQTNGIGVSGGGNGGTYTSTNPTVGGINTGGGGGGARFQGQGAKGGSGIFILSYLT